ncbi:hypothetical protein XELAEV_18009577mg [Xenopus laevis]|uniref:Uncharacterized protein n=1 Tax=Xenopus laevis TaxID=8355 RepID=A0A974DV11_XENLA|nr:hypothetical protein XELAEV_18009577mg [Xenopus laevis]
MTVISFLDSEDSQWIYTKEEGICEMTDLERMRKEIIGEIKWASYDYCMARDCLEFTRWWKIRLMAEVLQDKMKAKAQLKSLYKQLEEINRAIFRKFIDIKRAHKPPAPSQFTRYHVSMHLCVGDLHDTEVSEPFSIPPAVPPLQYTKIPPVRCPLTPKIWFHRQEHP